MVAFPRGTQTVATIQSDMSTSVENLVTSNVAVTQTDFEVPDRNVSIERETMSSPFAGLFPPSSSSRVGQSGSLLFPSAISHVLLSGAGTKNLSQKDSIRYNAFFRVVTSLCSFLFVRALQNYFYPRKRSLNGFTSIRSIILTHSSLFSCNKSCFCVSG